MAKRGKNAKSEAKLVVEPEPAFRGEFLSDEQASILTDIIRMYVGNALPYPSASSGVYMNMDRVLQQQSYLSYAGYDLYDQVELDPQVSAVLMTRKLAVAGLDWTIKPASDGARDVRIASLIENKLRAVPGFFQDMVELLDCLGKGFSVSEIVWAVDSEGFVVPNEILNRPQRRFQFDATSRWPKIRKMDNPFYGDPVAPRKFIVHRNSQKYENPFGDALDQRLYWMWLFKRTVVKFWMTHAQTSAAPVPMVQVPAGASAGLKQEALAIAQQVRSSSYGYLPEELKILWSEAKNVATTADTYEKFVRWADEQIAKCTLGQTLTTEGSGPNGSGSRALGAVHNSVRGDILEYDARSLAGTLSDTLVRWMCEMNFFGAKVPPRFEFVIEDSVDVVQQSRAIATLKSAGYTVKREYVENVLKIPLEDEEPAQQQGANGQQMKGQEDNANDDGQVAVGDSADAAASA